MAMAASHAVTGSPFTLRAGLLMVAGVLTWLSVPVALFIGGVGAVRCSRPSMSTSAS